MDNNLYVCINYKAKGDKVEDNYNLRIKDQSSQMGSKYLICGGIYNKNGGKLVYKARDFKEAMDLAHNNVFKKDKNDRFEEVKRDVLIIPSTIGKTSIV
ncbi:hypothetical protein HAHI6034_06825 [Hathewaya histolytica]|uniref:Uncharacterized protein n=1 Tax=Hathewaya histolytica TaxID=1498 RepID=A0A4U9RWN8_HATHI|nr:hypothetical protein [Hathewaya histolytica]VTQ96268.1 Uncharacterised protein [Hathewaya histolytica]